MMTTRITRSHLLRWERLCSQQHELADAAIYWEQLTPAIGGWRVGPCACSVTPTIAANEMIAAMRELLMQQGWTITSLITQVPRRYYVWAEKSAGQDCCYTVSRQGCARTALLAWLNITEQAMAVNDVIAWRHSLLNKNEKGGSN